MVEVGMAVVKVAVARVAAWVASGESGGERVAAAGAAAAVRAGEVAAVVVVVVVSRAAAAATTAASVESALAAGLAVRAIAAC
jgi:hypothetical protein